MTEQLHGDPRCHALLQQQRRRGVARVVQAGVAHAGSCEQRLPRLPVCRRSDRSTVWLCEDEVKLVPGRTGCQPLSGLPTPVTLQSIEQHRRQDERPNASPALGLDEDEAVPLLPLQGAPDSKRADDQVDVLPAKSERLALAQTEG